MYEDLFRQIPAKPDHDPPRDWSEFSPVFTATTLRSRSRLLAAAKKFENCNIICTLLTGTSRMTKNLMNLPLMTLGLILISGLSLKMLPIPWVWIMFSLAGFCFVYTFGIAAKQHHDIRILLRHG